MQQKWISLVELLRTGLIIPVKYLFTLCKSFPSEERFRLSDQLIRASRSIAANIAEGHGRYHYQEQIQFCRQARGSLSEVINHLITALDCQYISVEVLKESEKKGEVLLKLINGYLSHLKNQKAQSVTKP